jgi:hypothetical protein
LTIAVPPGVRAQTLCSHGHRHKGVHEHQPVAQVLERHSHSQLGAQLLAHRVLAACSCGNEALLRTTHYRIFANDRAWLSARGLWTAFLPQTVVSLVESHSATTGAPLLQQDSCVLVCDGVVSRLQLTDSTELCYSSLSFVQGSTRVLWDEMAAGTISHTFTTTRQV